MINLQLYLTHTSSYDQVELFDFEGIELVQSVQDVRDISKVFAEFTRTFTVPASKANNKAFKHFYNADIGRETNPADNLRFDARKRVNAELHLNYMPFKKGRLQLDAVNMKANKPYSYTITFFGDTIKLAETLGDKKLNELIHLSKIEVPYTTNNVLSLMQIPQDVTIQSTIIEDGLLVPLISSTQRLVYDSTDTTKEYNLYPHGDVTIDGATRRSGVDYLDLKPALRIHAIIKAIEAEFSNISFSTDFFTDSKTALVYNNPAYAELFMWLNTESGKVDVEMPQISMGASDVSQVVGDTDERELDGGYPNNTNHPGIHRIFSTPSDSAYYFDVTVTVSEPIQPYNFVLKKDGVEFVRVNGLTGTTRPMVASGSSDEAEERIKLPAGGYSFHLETQATMTFSFDIKLKFNRPTRLLSGIFGTRTFTIRYTMGRTITASDVSTATKDTAVLIPKMKVLDFITGLFKMFNLTAVTDKDGNIVVKTLDSFYSSGDTVDLTEYIDTTQSTIESVVPFSSIEFGYEGLETIFAAQHEEIAGKKWGTAMYPDVDSNPDDNTFLDIGDVYEVILPFGHQKYNRLYDADDPSGTLTNVQWGYAVDRQENPTLDKPLLLYVLKPNSQDAIEVTSSPTTSSFKTSYFIPSNSLNETNDTDSTNINFFAEMNEFAQVDFSNTLFKAYYENYITETFDPSSRLHKYRAIIPDDVLRNLELNDKIVVFDSEFRINKMSTNFLTKVTNLELLRKSNLVDLQDNMPDLTDNVSKTLGTVDTTQVTVDLTDRTL